jgi:K+-transporting ATPase ATPase B chain
MFILAFPQLGVLNIMELATPQSAMLSGILYKPLGAAAVLRANLLTYGLGGVVLFIGIKVVDVPVAIGLA